MAADVIGADQVVQLPHPVMGAEDFSYLLQNVPGGDDVPRRHARKTATR